MIQKVHFPAEFPILKGERIQLSSFSMEDAKAYFQMRSNPEFVKYLAQETMKSVSEAEAAISLMLEEFQNGLSISWKISPLNSSDLMGFIGLYRSKFKHFRTEVGYGLQQNYQKQGFMKEALALVVDYAFENMNFHSIMADTDPNNDASNQVLEKFGFKREAYIRENYFFNGKFLDSVYFGLLKSDLH